MLFDTHSPRRRRAVQVTFAFLAILMGGGLVLFGIGSNQSGGGIADIANGGTIDPAKEAEKKQKSAQEKLAANPKDEQAAADLAFANLQIAANKAFDAKGNVTKDGQPLLNAADASWTNYLKLGPAKPDAKVAFQYVTFYITPGATDYAKAARALEAVLVTRKESAGLYAQLALYKLAAGDNAAYKTARAKSLSLADSKERRDGIAEQLDDYEKQVKDAIAAQAKQAKESAKAGDSKSTTPPLKSLPNLGGVSTGGLGQ
ncbi:MAG: hypothetical protein J7513_07535 [Solirubrobacteraceae bacterium]|nr:hypothetical protein [Solirubrobacteraceae bacterium]